MAKAKKSAGKAKVVAKEDAGAAENVAMFAGKTIALTGTFVTMKRTAAKSMLEGVGAKVSSSVSGKTELLIYGDKAGSKLAKAQQLGVDVMTEAEWVATLAASGAGGEGMDDAAEKIAAAEKKNAKKMSKVNALIEGVNGPQIENWGATLPQLLRLYFKLFSKREDVHVYKNQAGRPTAKSVLLKLEKKVPPALLALHEELGSWEINWCFEASRDERSNWSEGYNGGRMMLKGLDRFRWWPPSDWEEDPQYVGSAMFDEFVNEGTAQLEYPNKDAPTEAHLVFDNANDCERHYMGSIEDYITNGAKAGFTWYWQMGGGGADDFIQQIFDLSLPKNTPTKVVREALIKRGAKAAEADSLMKWLGEDVVILLPLASTPEGKAVATLQKIFPGANKTSSRGIDAEMVTQLNTAGDPLTQAEWDSLCAAHQDFLASGGGGGSWESLQASGIPMAIYIGGNASKGEQAKFSLKKLEGLCGDGAKLSYSDFTGALAPAMDFKKADLSHSMLTDGTFDGCDFTGADLRGADFSGASLIGVNFADADLRGTDFEATDLTCSNFIGAKMKGAMFPGADLSDVIYE